ncbi:nucleoside-diphosphate-sugar epimerase [Lysobacter sp. HA35]
MCRAYQQEYGFNAIVAMPTNLYGPGDNYHAENSHVVAALVRRIVEAERVNADEVVVWGTGSPLRELLHVDDLADAVLFLADRYKGTELINVGSGDEISIADLARLIADLSGYKGALRFDTTRPDGTPRKRLDTHRLEALGWKRKITLEQGLRETIGAYRASVQTSHVD